MKNAYECKETYTRDGKCVTRERTVGPVVIVAVVLILAMLTGQRLEAFSVLWQFLR